MKLLHKEHSSQRRLIEILRVVDDANKPIGARAISDALSSRGYELGERAVRYNLKILDELGFTTKEGYSGRVPTHLGIKELNDALIDDRIGFVNTKIEEYMYRTTLDIRSMEGNAICNISIINKDDYERAAGIIHQVLDAGYAVSRKVQLLDEMEDKTPCEIPKGCMGIATVCSITIDGLLLREGIPVNTSFAGTVEISDGAPIGFTDLIAYSGSSLDPVRAFMARRMTRVLDAVNKRSGKVLANIREVPIAAANSASRLLEQLKSVGIGGIIMVSDQDEPNLGCPVAPGMIGISMFAGINCVVAVEESGIRIRTSPISSLIDYGRMAEIR